MREESEAFEFSFATLPKSADYADFGRVGEGFV